jgi:transcriptional regulator with XRE-family HTH domain
LEALRRVRTMRGMNQVDLARASGVAQNTISEIELGKREARPATLRKLARALDVEIADFFEAADRPKVPAPYSQQLTLNGELEEERRVVWESTVKDARRLRETGRDRLEELLAAWHASKKRGEDSSARRAYLDEMGELLQRAYDAEMALLEALYEPRIAEQWPEVQTADRFYVELWHLVQGAGLSIRTGTSEDAQDGEGVQERRPEAVEEPEAA